MNTKLPCIYVKDFWTAQNIKYTDDFVKATELEQYLGTGNPNSQILIVGKEVATDEIGSPNPILEKQNKFNYLNNVIDWQQNVKNTTKTQDIPNWIFNDPLKKNNPLFAFK